MIVIEPTRDAKAHARGTGHGQGIRPIDRAVTLQRGDVLAMRRTAARLLICVIAAGFAPAWPVAAQAPAPAPKGAPQTAPQMAPQAALSPCTGVAEAKCATVTGCVWLPGYKIKNAPDVAGYCRPAPKSLSARRPGVTAVPAAPPK